MSLYFLVANIYIAFSSSIYVCVSYIYMCVCVYLYIHLFNREKKREKEREELWKKLNELEIERRSALTETSNNSVPATTAPATRTRP